MLIVSIWFLGVLSVRTWADDYTINCNKLKNFSLECGKDVPVACAFIPLKNRSANKACKKVYSKDDKNIELCRWNPISPQLTKGKYLPCEPNICLEELKDLRRIPELGQIIHSHECAEPNPIKYPPSYEKVKQFYNDEISDYQLDKLRCQFKEGEDIYNKVFTCLLPLCGARLRIANKSLACLPPVFPLSESKYCPLYQVETNYIVNSQRNGGCYLPPLCGKEKKNGKKGTIDPRKSMVPWVNGKLDPNYCEELCPDPESFLNFTISDRCRQLPPCFDDSLDTDTNYDQYEMSMCRPWCDKRDSLMRVNNITWEDKSNPICMPKPLCFKNGRTPVLGALNPWGYKHCVEQNKPCEYGMTSKTHYCIDEKLERNKNILSNNDWIFIIVWPLSLFFYILIVAATLLYYGERWCFKKRKMMVKGRHAFIEELKEELLINEAL